MPISQCVHVFDALAGKLFQRPQGRTSLIKRLSLTLKGWYKDGHYDARALEHCLREYLGTDDRMFGHKPGVLSTKVGVIASTIGNASPVIFTNYNRPGARKEDCGKCGYYALGLWANRKIGCTHICPEKIEDEPCIWEA